MKNIRRDIIDCISESLWRRFWASSTSMLRSDIESNILENTDDDVIGNIWSDTGNKILNKIGNGVIGIQGDLQQIIKSKQTNGKYFK